MLHPATQLAAGGLNFTREIKDLISIPRKLRDYVRISANKDGTLTRART